MAQIVTVRKMPAFQKQNQKTVLAGGCFDILHPGHVIFLEKAKRAGDILIVLLESDEKVKKLKGINRPVHNQKARARILSALRFVDYVVMMPFLKNNAAYDQLIGKIKPDVIAATYKNPNMAFYKRSAESAGAKLKLVTRVIGDYSTTQLLTK